MDDHCDVALIALALFLVACVTVFFMKVAQPTGAIVDLILPRV